MIPLPALGSKLDMYLQRIKNRALPYFTYVLRPFEKAALKRVDTKAEGLKPVFIVSAPRSGSTILYQIITKALKVEYTSNLAAICYHSLFTGWRLQKFLYGDKAHNSFSSNMGRTKGWLSPHESGKFWYRWFPMEPPFVEQGFYHSKDFTELRKTIRAIEQAGGKPLVFKNTVNGERLQVLQQVFPDALVIFCKRDPYYTAKSIYEHRVKVQGNDTTWWATKPNNYKDLLKLPPKQQVAAQVYFLEKRIEEDILLFPEKQRITISYEDLCKDTQGTLARLESFMKQNGLETSIVQDAELPALKVKNKKVALEGEVDELQTYINHYYGH